MKKFMGEDFLLSTETAVKLYDACKDVPIYDWHCHLSPKEIYENKQPRDITELWLGGDHYKWRLMRNYGVDEEYITGSKSDKEKFKTYCAVLGKAFGNPLYHWSQVELETYFNCTLEINEANAEDIWEQCNDYIEKHKITPQSLIEGSNVKIIFTTNEIFDDLEISELKNRKVFELSGGQKQRVAIARALVKKSQLLF
mgnify:CR=1 FL=1